MSDGTKIEWTDATWNPITGCSVVSAGCKNCYAMKLAGTRLQHHPSRAGLTVDTKNGPVWTGEVRFNEQWLDQPLHWKKPRLIFPCAHSDMFHPNVLNEWLPLIFGVMAASRQHIFQVLTKRAERMREVLNDPVFFEAVACEAKRHGVELTADQWPLSNVWLGVSVEDQSAADERIPLLLDTPAVVHWVSAEPLLGDVDLTQHLWGSQEPCEGCPKDADCACGYTPRIDLPDQPCIDWVVVGGESGPNARPMHPQWARSLRDQCAAANVPFLFKQWGEWLTDDQRASLTVDHVMVKEKFKFHDGNVASNVGKKIAGRLLDGVQHDGYPA